MSLTVYDPTLGPEPRKASIARRPASLEDGVLGLIDNGKQNSDVVLDRIAERLRQRYGVGEVMTVRKWSFSHGIESSEAERLSQRCAFVLAGVGD